jgi:putative DNA primase/helicase
MSGPVQRVHEALEAHGCTPRRSGTAIAARCPGHEDKVASLTVNEGDDGRALLFCHTRCTQEHVVESLGLTMRDLFPEANGTPPRERSYPIRDAAGSLIATHVRLDVPDGKRVWWERDGRKGLGGLPLKDLPLYGAHLVADWPRDSVIVVTEGEKACDALLSRGIPALGTVTGAAVCPGSAALEVLRGRPVALWPDHDEPGAVHMRGLATALDGIAASVSWIEWGSAKGDDVADFKGSTEVLRALVESAAPAPAPEPATPREKPQRRQQGSALTLDDVEPATEQVDGTALLGDVAAALATYVVIEPVAVTVITLWVAMTYLVDHVDCMPRLLLRSPTRACGKSRLLALLAALVRRALTASSITPSAVFRLIDAARPTLLLDEIDNARLHEKPELLAVLNSGHTRAMAYTWCNVGEQHEPRRFNTWAAIALAAIDKTPGLPDTITSRSLPIAMRRRTRTESVRRMREGRISAELEPLRRRLARWCGDHAETIAAADPSVPEALDDRQADNAAPLLAIADAAGGEWPARARHALLELAGNVPEEPDASIQLLHDLREVFVDNDRLSTKAVIEALTAMEDRPWGEWREGKSITPRGLAKLLKGFRIEPTDVRLGERVLKGYTKEAFEDAWLQYPAANPRQARQGAPDAADAPVSEPQHAGDVADARDGSDPRQSGVVADVADAAGREAAIFDALEGRSR